jgi:hypothetical protein
MTPELRDAWIDALRSGDYKQASGRLETPEGFCCMGVLAKVVGVQPDPTSGRLADAFYGETVGLSEENQMKLARLNDKRKFSFERIADVIELFL